MTLSISNFLQTRRQTVPMAAVIAVIFTIMAVQILTPSAKPGLGVKAQTLQAQLNSQVDTASGEPRTGRDPALQNQNSLASAASQPSGVGQRLDIPAAGVIGDHSHHATGSDVSGNLTQSGLGTNGCFIDYGKPGEQCLPAQSATAGNLTCDGVHKYFPRGIIVSGTDRFQLDKNLDGTACGQGD